jgi:hypothetical protein
MSVVLDQATLTVITDSSLNSASGTHTVPSGTQLLLVFLQGWVVGETSGSDGGPPTSITWNGEALTRITLPTAWGNSQHGLWYRANPTAGSGGTIAISGGDSTVSDGGIIHVCNLSGVDLTVGTSGIRSYVDTQADSRTTITLSPTTTATDLIIAQWSQQGSTTTTGQTYGGTSGTQSVKNGTGFNIDAAFLTTSQPTNSGQSVTFLPATGGSYPSGVAVSIAAAAGGAAEYFSGIALGMNRGMNRGMPTQRP